MWLASALVLGAIVGSFLTTVIERLPRGASPLRGRSRCPACRATLGGADLIPVLSFLVCRGRCRHCGSPIPRWHLGVEAATILLFVLAGSALAGRQSLFEVGLVFVLLALLLALAVIDLQHAILPDLLVVLLAGVGLARSVTVGTPGVGPAVLGGILGLVILGALAFIPWRGSGQQGATSAMGLGDVKLAGAMGLVLGWRLLLVSLLGAFVAGGLVAAGLLLSGRATPKSRIPFGPFLAGATGLLLVFPRLGDAFFRLLGLGVD